MTDPAVPEDVGGAPRRRIFVQAPVEPSPADGVNAFAIGTIGFVVLELLALWQRDGLRTVGYDWLVWTGLAGVIIGLGGLGYALRRRSVHRRRPDRGVTPSE
jgi:hypothetical protein